jgi:hypothetical protein
METGQKYGLQQDGTYLTPYTYTVVYNSTSVFETLVACVFDKSYIISSDKYENLVKEKSIYTTPNLLAFNSSTVNIGANMGYQHIHLFKVPEQLGQFIDSHANVNNESSDSGLEHSLSESTEPVSEPVSESTEPVSEPVSESTEPVSEPVSESTEPVSESTEPVSEPARNPAVVEFGPSEFMAHILPLPGIAPLQILMYGLRGFYPNDYKSFDDDINRLAFYFKYYLEANGVCNVPKIVSKILSDYNPYDRLLELVYEAMTLYKLSNNALADAVVVRDNIHLVTCSSDLVKYLTPLEKPHTVVVMTKTAKYTVLCMDRHNSYSDILAACRNVFTLDSL